MKRIALLGALLAAAVSACTPATNSNGNANLPPSNSNSNAVATPTPAPTVSANDITDKEKQIWDTIKNKNWDAFAAFVADDQVYVGSDGVNDKAATVNGVKKLDITEYTFADTKVVQLGGDAAVITYTSNVKGTYEGRPIPPLRESSAWVRRGGNWLAVYHQDSEVQTAPAGASGASSPTPSATASASPASSPAASPVPAADATGMERQVWDALMRKDWNAFAAFLADDFLEVEPDGVYDKAGSVAGVRNFDFAGVTLSDFREVKINPSVTLVTYVVRGPRAPFNGKGMRHTSIWVNRAGRWLAAFHQGTTITR